MQGEGFNLSIVERVSELAQHVYFWLLAIVTMVGAAIKFWHLRTAPKTLLAFVQGKHGVGTVLDRKLLKCLSCVVVDDKPEDFPVDFMRGFFGSVIVETTVSLNDAPRLSKFDVIFLDVADVVAEDSRRGGAILIDRIRQYRKDGIVVSVSSKKYDVEVTKYFEAADIRIRKPVTARAIEEQFVAHLSTKVGPEALAREVDEAVMRVGGARKLRGVVREVMRARGQSMVAPRHVRLAGVEESFARLIAQLGRLA